MSKNIIAVVDLQLNETTLEKKSVSAEDVLNGLSVDESDTMDAFEISTAQMDGYDVSLDFFLQNGSLRHAILVDSYEEIPHGKKIYSAEDPDYEKELNVYAKFFMLFHDNNYEHCHTAIASNGGFDSDTKKATRVLRQKNFEWFVEIMNRGYSAEQIIDIFSDAAEYEPKKNRNAIEIPTHLGKLCAEIGGNPDYPEIFVYIRRDDGVEIDLVAAGVKDDAVKAYLYGDTTRDDYTASHLWHPHEIEEV